MIWGPRRSRWRALRFALLCVVTVSVGAGCAQGGGSTSDDDPTDSGEIPSDAPTDAAGDSSSDAVTDGAAEDAADLGSGQDSDADTGPLPDAVTDGGPDADADTGGAPPPDVSPIDGGCIPGQACQLDEPPQCHNGLCNGVGHCVPVPIDGCCVSDADCAQENVETACGTYRCLVSICLLEIPPGCCDAPSDCDDGEGCTEDGCLEPGGQCSHCPQGCPCPSTGPVFSKDFEAGTLASQGLAVQGGKTNAMVTWRISDRRYLEPPGALWAGHKDCPTYYNGPLTEDCQPAAGGDSQPVDVTMTTGLFSLTQSPGGHVVLMWVWSEVEGWKTGGDDEPDVLSVFFQEGFDGDLWPLVTTQEVGKNTLGEWRLMGADLSAWNATSGRMHFQFQTLGDADNHHEGIYVDSLQVIPRCAGGCCESDGDCGELVSADPCQEARCIDIAQGAGAVCALVPRSPGEPCTPCSFDATCADENPCTADVCTGDGICENALFCCFEAPVLTQGFEAGLSGWFLVDQQIFDDVFFQPTALDAVEGTYGAGLSQSPTGTYATGDEVTVGLLTPSFSLPDSADLGAEIALSFWLKLSTEWDGQPYDNPAGLDRLKVEVVSAASTTEIWSSDEVEGSTLGQWVPIEISLLPWAGENIQLRIQFDTVDGEANDYAGPLLDDIQVGQLCPE